LVLPLVFLLLLPTQSSALLFPAMSSGTGGDGGRGASPDLVTGCAVTGTVVFASPVSSTVVRSAPGSPSSQALPATPATRLPACSDSCSPASALFGSPGVNQCSPLKPCCSPSWAEALSQGSDVCPLSSQDLQDHAREALDDGLARLRQDPTDGSSPFCCSKDGTKCRQDCIAVMAAQASAELRWVALLAVRIQEEKARLKEQGHDDRNLERGSTAHQRYRSRLPPGTSLTRASECPVSLPPTTPLQPLFSKVSERIC
jgi:hypothetical protein